jgi:hypothetical protein
MDLVGHSYHVDFKLYKGKHGAVWFSYRQIQVFRLSIASSHVDFYCHVLKKMPDEDQSMTNNRIRKMVIMLWI